jgi:hypothetical protein
MATPLRHIYTIAIFAGIFMPENRADDLTANVFVTGDNASGTSKPEHEDAQSSNPENGAVADGDCQKKAHVGKH